MEEDYKKSNSLRAAAKHLYKQRLTLMYSPLRHFGGIMPSNYFYKVFFSTPAISFLFI